MARRITKARIQFLSLCERGANQMPTILKEDGAIETQMLTKAMDDFDVKGELLAVVYAPEVRDSQGDIASADVIKEMAYAAARDGINVDIKHNGKAIEKSKAFIAEQFIVPAGDSRFKDFKDYSGKPVDVTGAWATVIKVEDPELRKLYKDGKWNGVSMGGNAEVRAEKHENDEDTFFERLKKFFGLPTTKHSDEDIDMKPEELKTLLEANNATLLKAMDDKLVAAGVKKADDKKDESKADEAVKAPVFKGDMTNPADIKKHRKAVKLHALQKAVDWNDDASVATYEAEIAKLNAADGDGKGEEQQPGKDPEVARLEKELADALKRSNRPVNKEEQASGGNGGNDGGTNITGLSKSESDAVALARKVAEESNKQRGMK